MAGHRLDDDPPALDREAFHFGHVLDVDEQRRVRETEVHRGKKTLAARQHHRVGVTGEGNNRLFQGRLVPE